MKKYIDETNTNIESEANELLEITKTLTESQRRELLAFARGYKLASDKSA